MSFDAGGKGYITVFMEKKGGFHSETLMVETQTTAEEVCVKMADKVEDLRTRNPQMALPARADKFQLYEVSKTSERQIGAWENPLVLLRHWKVKQSTDVSRFVFKEPQEKVRVYFVDFTYTEVLVPETANVAELKRQVLQKVRIKDDPSRFAVYEIRGGEEQLCKESDLVMKLMSQWKQPDDPNSDPMTEHSARTTGVASASPSMGTDRFVLANVADPIKSVVATNKTSATARRGGTKQQSKLRDKYGITPEIVRVQFVDHSWRSFSVLPSTTTDELCAMVAAKLDLLERYQFGLFVKIGDKDKGRLLSPDEFPVRVQMEWRQLQANKGNSGSRSELRFVFQEKTGGSGSSVRVRARSHSFWNKTVKVKQSVPTSSGLAMVMPPSELEKQPWKSNAKVEGWLNKQSTKGLGGWKRRYFVLQSHYLFYFKDIKDRDTAMPKGIINLVGTSVVPGETETNKKYCFGIKTPFRTYFLTAMNDPEYRNWMKQVAEATKKTEELRAKDKSRVPRMEAKPVDGKPISVTDAMEHHKKQLLAAHPNLSKREIRAMVDPENASVIGSETRSVESRPADDMTSLGMESLGATSVASLNSKIVSQPPSAQAHRSAPRVLAPSSVMAPRPARNTTPSRVRPYNTKEAASKVRATDRQRDYVDSSELIKRRTQLERQKYALQITTFSNWCNVYLRERNMFVADLVLDFADGVFLINLMEILTGRNFVKYHKSPRILAHALDNFTLVFGAMKRARVDIPRHCSAEDIVDGNIVVILRLVWAIILKFELEGFKRPPSFSKLKELLLIWVYANLSPAYPRQKISDFGSSWADGLAFAALMHKRVPEMIPLDKMSPDTPEENLEIALNVAMQQFGIPILFSPSDLVAASGNVDALSIMTYLLMARRALRSLGQTVTEEDVQAAVQADVEIHYSSGEEDDKEPGAAGSATLKPVPTPDVPPPNPSADLAASSPGGSRGKRRSSKSPRSTRSNSKSPRRRGSADDKELDQVLSGLTDDKKLQAYVETHVGRDVVRGGSMNAADAKKAKAILMEAHKSRPASLPPGAPGAGGSNWVNPRLSKDYNQWKGKDDLESMLAMGEEVPEDEMAAMLDFYANLPHDAEQESEAEKDDDA